MALSHIIENEARPFTFQIQLQLVKDGRFIQAPIGTAFAISDDGYLVTALHVVQAADKYKDSGAKMMYGFGGAPVDTPQIKMQGNFTYVPGDVVSKDEKNDIAIIKLGVKKLSDINSGIVIEGFSVPEIVPKTCTLDTRRPLNGEEIAISGYPLREPSLVTTWGHIASNWTLADEKNGDKVERYLGDITANPGNSGGPVYLAKSGKVVGVCVAGKLTETIDKLGNPAELMQTTGLTYIVPAQAVIDLLSKETQ